jgi:phage gp46-like protein
MLSEAKHLERGILRCEPAQDDGWWGDSVQGDGVGSG